MQTGTVAPRTDAGGPLPFPGTGDEKVVDDGAPRPVAEAVEPLPREAGWAARTRACGRSSRGGGVTFSLGTGLSQADRVLPVPAAKWRGVDAPAA